MSEAATAPRVIDAHTHVGVELSNYLRGGFPYGHSLPSLVAEGTALGIDEWVVLPMISNLAMNLAGLRAGVVSLDGGLESIPYAFENRRLLAELYDVFPELGDRVRPFVIVDPARETAAQVTELRRLRDVYAFAGIKIHPTATQSPVKSLLERGNGLLDLAAEWDLPLLIHSSVWPGDTWANAGDILDVAEAMPHLRFCLAHSCRFHRGYLDRLATLPNAWFDCSAHVIHCQLATDGSPYLPSTDERVVADYRDAGSVLATLASTYPNRMVWGSDAPYQRYVSPLDGDALHADYADEVRCLRSLPARQQEQVAHANALAWLGSPAPARP